MRCDNCSSSDFEKFSDREYRCRYCGSLKIVEPPAHRGYGTGAHAGMEILEKKQVRIALSVVAALILLSVFATVMLLRGGRPARVPAASSTTAELKPSRPSEFGPDRIDRISPPKGAFERVAAFPDGIGNVYIVGMYKNTGRAVIRKPMVQVTLYSKEERKVAMGRGYAVREALLPGEETPVRVLVNHPPEWTRYEVFHMAAPPYPFTPLVRPPMELRNCRLAQGRYAGCEIRGEIVNAGRAPVKHVQLIGAVYDASKNMIGVGADYAGGHVIRPGDYAPFVIRVLPVFGSPESFAIDYEASESR